MEMDNQPNQPQGPAPAPEMPQSQHQGPAPAPTMPQGPSQPMNPNPMGQPQSQKTDTLGIISLVMVLFIPLVGMILGFVGMSKAKKEGYSGTLSKVGAIVNTIFVVLGVLFIIFWLSIFQSVQDEAREQLESVDSDGKISIVEGDKKAEDFEVEYTSDLSAVCQGEGWPTNVSKSSAGNTVGVYTTRTIYPGTYSTEYVNLDDFESIESSSPEVVDYIACASNEDQEAVEVVQCDLEVDDTPVKAPMSRKPFSVKVFDPSSKSEVASFTVQSEKDCPFFVTVDPSDNSFDARIDQDSLNSELAKAL